MVQRVRGRGPQAEMLVKALGPFISGMHTARARMPAISAAASVRAIALFSRAAPRPLPWCVTATASRASTISGIGCRANPLRIRSGACSGLTSPTTRVWKPTTTSPSSAT
jgi:hypothetical protein